MLRQSINKILINLELTVIDEEIETTKNNEKLSKEYQAVKEEFKKKFEDFMMKIEKISEKVKEDTESFKLLLERPVHSDFVMTTHLYNSNVDDTIATLSSKMD